MIARKVILLLIAISCLSSSAPAQEKSARSSPSVVPSSEVRAQDFTETVLPITELKLQLFGISGNFGTGFCVDPQCRFVGTAYHVAMMGQPRKIKGQKVARRYLATGPDDEGATVNSGPSMRPLRYTLRRDLAIFELRHPVPHFHGMGFSLDDLHVGQEIDIYAYPKGAINPIRKLRQFHGTFKALTTTGLLAFDYHASPDQAIRPGASGGVVVDSKSQRIVGILSDVAADGQPIALAVPVQSLADFLGKVQPWLAQSLFPTAEEISPVSADLYPKYVPPPPAGGLRQRTEEPPEIQILREKAQLLADSMRNFIAVQTFAWGRGAEEPAAVAAYEVQVRDGYQRFRKYPDGKKEFQDVPFPPLDPVMVPGGEWSEMPQMVGTELRLHIHQAPDAVVHHQRIKVFQYWASPEDGVCQWKTVLDLLFAAIHKLFTVACSGEVWTDEDTNILRISEHYELPGKWRDFRGVVTYGWLRRGDEVPYLIPLTISTQAEFKKKIYWCRGRFTDYRVFVTRAKILATEPDRTSRSVAKKDSESPGP